MTAGRDAGHLHAVPGTAVPFADASALFGGVVWAGAVLVGDLSAIERALTLAPLVLVPLGLGMAATTPFTETARRPYTVALLLQPLAALALLGSLLWRGAGAVAAVLAAPWVVVAGLLALTGVARVAERGLDPLGETVIDAGLAYTVVAAVALVVFHLGVTLWFDPVIVLLTAVHFHYAGFALGVVAGLTGRSLPTESRLYRVLAGVVLVGPGLVGLGISFSPVLEIVAVGLFTAGVAVLAGFVVVRVAPARPRVQGGLLAVSALALPVSMLLALGYAAVVFTGHDLPGLTIGTMVALHGSLNAFGFALLGLAGWRVAVPSAATGPAPADAE